MIHKLIKSTEPLRHAVLVGNALMDAPAEALLRREAQTFPPPLIVGVDGGAARVLALGIVPHVVTGDFDSLSAAELANLEARGALIVPTPDQDYNDLDKALGYVLARADVGVVRVYGALGGRIDHAYSALSVLIKYGVWGGYGERVAFVDGVGNMLPVFGGARDNHSRRELNRNSLVGRTLSLLAFGTVRGVTLTGTRWTLTDATLAPGVRDGTLNEIVDEQVTISHRKEDGAALLIYLHHALPAPRVVAR